jgi:EpsI family protein
MPLPDSSSSDSLSTTQKEPVAFFRLDWFKYAAPLTLLCLTYYFLYQNGLTWLFEIWSHNDYSHGYLIPFVSLYIVWEQKKRYTLLPVTPAYPAAAIVVLISLGLLFISRSSAFIQLEAASLFLIISGILLLLFGWPITRAAMFPWLYLSFALPWFDLFLSRVQPPFQRISAIIGSKLLSLIYPVYLHDVYIQLPSINMEVARACSGVAFFISVLAIGIPLVYLTQRSWKRAIVVLGLGLIITVLANGLRVGMAGIMGENFGPELLHGPSHVLQGWFVAWFGWAGLFIVNWLISRRDTSTAPRLFERWKLQAINNTKQDQMGTISPKAIYSVSVILALCAVVTYFLSPRPVPLPNPLSSLPTQMAVWQGTENDWLDNKSFFPKADDHLERRYDSTQAATPLYLYIAYFEKQTEYKRLVRQLRLPLHKKTVTITLPSSKPGEPPHKVNKTTLIQGGVPYDVFFWYQFSNGKTVTGQNQARLMALQNGILHHRNNGAIIVVGIRQNIGGTNISTDVPDSIAKFLKEAGPEVSRLIP